MAAALALPEAAVAPPSLRIFDRVPAGHLAYAVSDRSCMPLVQPGEVLVVSNEPRLYPDMLPEGQWCLIQWITPARRDWERDSVHQTVGIPRKRITGDGQELWGYGPPCHSAGGMIYCGDFGFSFERMTDLIRGRVVGIYRPS